MHILKRRCRALAAAALVALAGCGPGTNATTPEQTPPPVATRCEHDTGSCALSQPMPAGAPCDCGTPFGMVTGHAR